MPTQTKLMPKKSLALGKTATEVEKLFFNRKLAYSFKLVLQYFLDSGATVKSITTSRVLSEAVVVLEYKGVEILLRSKNRLFFSILNSYLSVSLSHNKYSMFELLRLHGIPTPETWRLKFNNGLPANFLNQPGKFVVKPKVGAHGDGITIGISGKQAVHRAIRYASRFHREAIVQRHVEGDEYRLLCLDYKIIAATRRRSPYVVGNGYSTVEQLVDEENLKRLSLFQKKGLQNWQSLHVYGISKKEVLRVNGSRFLVNRPHRSELVQLFDKRNSGLGGLTEDVTDQITIQGRSSYSAFLRIIDSPICGIDVISTDIKSPLSAGETKVIELNTRPGLMTHKIPHTGRSRDIERSIAKAIYEKHKKLQNHL